MLWVLDYLRDLESDMSAFHRIDDMHSMPAPRFFGFATRLPAYQGVLAARVAKEQQDGSRPRATQAGTDSRNVAATRGAIEADPALAGVIEFGRG